MHPYPVGADDSVRPQDVSLFSEICGEFVTSQRADVGIGPYGALLMHPYPVGADDSVRPQDVSLFSEICGEFVTSQRADAHIDPYRVRRKFAERT